MQEIANSILWALVIIQGICILRLRDRIYRPHRPTELIHSEFGAPLGEPFPISRFESIGGEMVDVREPSGRNTLLLVTAPSCGACKSLYPLINPFIQKHGAEYQLVSLMFGEQEDIDPIARSFDLKHPIISLTPELLEATYTDRFPFGYLLSPDGVVVSKGAIQNEIDLELLRTWRPKPLKKSTRFSFYRNRQEEGVDPSTLS